MPFTNAPVVHQQARRRAKVQSDRLPAYSPAGEGRDQKVMLSVLNGGCDVANKTTSVSVGPAATSAVPAEVPFAWSPQDIVRHAEGADAKWHTYDIAALKTDLAPDCLGLLVSALRQGGGSCATMPPGLQRVFVPRYGFNSDGYTKSVLAHYVGGTHYFRGQSRAAFASDPDIAWLLRLRPGLFEGSSASWRITFTGAATTTTRTLPSGFWNTEGESCPRGQRQAMRVMGCACGGRYESASCEPWAHWAVPRDSLDPSSLANTPFPLLLLCTFEVL